MRRLLAAALACAVLSVHAAEAPSWQERRISPYDFACCADVECSTVLSTHQRQGTATAACSNRAFKEGRKFYVDGGTYEITSSTPAPEPEPEPPPVNNPPTITGTPTAAIVAGQPYSFVPVAADPDADTLAFTIVNRPNWATFNAATGALTGTPAAANVGISSSIVITVSDGKASASTPAFTITVTAPPAATLPAVGGISATVSPNPTDPANSNVALSWLAVNGATGYAIERCTGATCTDNFVARGTTTNTAFTDPNVPGGATYRYRIRGTSAGATGAWSALRNVTTPSATTPPPPPASTVQLSWSWNGPALDTDGAPITVTGYRLLYSRTGQPTQTLNLGAVTSHELTGLAAGRWTFQVVTLDSLGRASSPTNPAFRDVQ